MSHVFINKSKIIVRVQDRKKMYFLQFYLFFSSKRLTDCSTSLSCTFCMGDRKTLPNSESSDASSMSNNTSCSSMPGSSTSSSTSNCSISPVKEFVSKRNNTTSALKKKPGAKNSEAFLRDANNNHLVLSLSSSSPFIITPNHPKKKFISNDYYN